MLTKVAAQYQSRERVGHFWSTSTMLPVLACGVGVYLGLQFNVLVLLPFSVLGTGAFIVFSWSVGHSLWESAAVTLVPIIFAQAGYVLGLTARGTYGNLLARLNASPSKPV